MTDANTARLLESVASELTDAALFYERAAKDVSDTNLARLFEQAAEHRRDARRKIRPFLSDEAMAELERGTSAGAGERTWTEFLALFVNDRNLFLDRLAEEEAKLTAAIDAALAGLPEGAARAAVQEAHARILTTQEEVASLRAGGI